VLTTETAKVTCDGQSLMPHKIDETMARVCAGIRKPCLVKRRAVNEK
jgi:hypothetical protein